MEKDLNSRTLAWNRMTDLVEETTKYLNETPDDGEQELLNEIISLRTGLIAGFLAKTKQHANALDTEVRRLRSDASGIQSKSNTTEQRFERLGDALETIASLFYLQRKMMMYSSLTSAATGMDSAKQTKILQKVEKQLKGRR